MEEKVHILDGMNFFPQQNIFIGYLEILFNAPW